VSSVHNTGGTGISHEVDALRRHLSDIVALSALSAVWAGSSPPQIAQSLSEVVRDTLQADAVYVGLRGAAGGDPSEGAALSRGAHAGLFDDIRAEMGAWFQQPQGAPIPAVPQFAGSALVTPIGIHAEYGVIVSLWSDPTVSSDAQHLLLNVAANQATMALLSGRAREEQRIADTLQRIGAAVAAELDIEKMIQTVTDETTTLTGANFGAFFYNIENAEGGSYMLYTLAGAPREAFSRFPMPRSTAVFAPTFKGARVVRMSDVTVDPRFGRSAPYYGMPPGHLPVRSYLAVAVVSRTGKVYGGLFFGHKDVGRFTERHERLAVGMAAWAALAMDNGHLYSEAQRANAAKDQFLATLSHELRTPLNAMTGWLSMLRRSEQMRPEAVEKAWVAIDRNAGALTGLVEDLLDVSRIALGRIRLADGQVDLNEVVRDSVRAIEPAFAEKKVSLSTELPADPCDVRGDVGRLRQVTANLLSNAVKFTATGGHVSVRVTCDDTRVIVTVEDSGIGIHPDFLPHVFERFRQGGTDPNGGLGLGLAIVKNLVELHGGTVAAASEGIGRGSQFTITLPRLR
jgi:signal transduction histidine kinase